MKQLLTFLFILFALVTSGQTDLGVGLLSIDYNDKTVLHFYTDTTDKKPTKTIEFFNDTSIDSWNIRNLSAQGQWLNPEVLWLDYHSFVFRCKVQANGWYKVVVNNNSNNVYWLKKSKWTKYVSWEKFLKEMFSVARLPNEKQKIRNMPSDGSNEIRYAGQDCFQVRSMKGDWIEIFTADYCDEDYTDSKIKVKSGWIRWRKGNKLLIEYFITS